MIKVKSLNSKSKIAVISPSNGLPYLFNDIYELGLKNMEELFDFKIVEYPTARMSPDKLYKHPELRAKDINDAFKDDSIDGIIISIGGYESIRILKFLDIEMIKNNPKLIMGFSDATTFLSYLSLNGLITFYGPSVMAGFAQLKHIDEKYKNNLIEFLTDLNVPYKYKSYDKYTNGYKDWNDKDTLGECESFYKNTGLDFFNESGKVKGKLWGGCIEVLEFLKGTKYFPKLEFFNDKILFFETSEEKPTPDQVGYMLRNYGIQGILNRVKGIVFGRAKDYSESEILELRKIIKDIIEIEFKVKNISIVMKADFGHTDPKWILPYGMEVLLDADSKNIVLLESPFN
ncbi:LD-carboxypeptidase [Clostridiaceae bacterium HSG29]|nr:LD-carboxypeptidase [Clostridiaceae bacterium HSG29]